MRVIAGLYKGRIISTVKDRSVRPALDRARQTVFDMLTNRIAFEGATVLDLFAGSGSLGIEALSRGAAHATFVENNEQAALFIESNVRLLGCEGATEILEMDAMAYLRGKRPAFDIVFADPPYRFEQTEELPQMIFERNLVQPGGYLLIEHTTDLRFESTSLYTAGPEKRFGRTIVTFFREKA
jgi:16S rRNA (guanine966-N2)-methyltransferase